MDCRIGCGACCVAISISTLRKPAGVRCVHLTADNKCAVWGTPDYPPVCRDFKAMPEVCGESREEALELLAALEKATRP